ncbi:MAG: GNAT family N-acetyltransferase, partial [Treponema sp.]|nr:GNAT family N-acetyltransferase [Treponema sp.]
MFFRKAVDSEIDCNLVYALSNDPIVRQNSFNKNKIEFTDHIKWFKKTVFDSNILFLLAFEDKSEQKFIGQIRFNRQSLDSEACIISLSITEDFRGKGIAKDFIESGIEQVKKNWKLVKTVIAEVKSENVASNKLFIKDNFNLEST